MSGCAKVRSDPRLTLTTLCVGCRLEQLHGIARWIFDQDLPSPRPGDDIVAALDARLLQRRHLGIEIAALHDDSVPATRLGPASIRHRLRSPARSLGWAQNKLQVLLFDDGEEGP